MIKSPVFRRAALAAAVVAAVAFIAIAGSGGLANTLFSNYTRDKGWGMGAHVGAIPSAMRTNIGVRPAMATPSCCALNATSTSKAQGT